MLEVGYLHSICPAAAQLTCDVLMGNWRSNESAFKGEEAASTVARDSNPIKAIKKTTLK